MNNHKNYRKKIIDNNVFPNRCPITLEKITRRTGVLVISYTPNSDFDLATVSYYRSKIDFKQAWVANHHRCPQTRKSHCISIPLRQLNQNQFLRLLDEQGQLQEGALKNNKPNSYARDFFYTLKALLWAIKINDIKKVETILTNIDSQNLVHVRNRHNQTLAMYSTAHSELLRILIDVGVDINLKNNVHNTSLMIAITKGHIDSVKLLLANGARINIRNKAGYNALDLAIETNPELIDLLLSKLMTLDKTQQCSIIKNMTKNKLLSCLKFSSQENQLNILKFLFAYLGLFNNVFSIRTMVNRDLYTIYALLTKENKEYLMNYLFKTYISFHQDTVTRTKLFRHSMFDRKYEYPSPTKFDLIINLGMKQFSIRQLLKEGKQDIQFQIAVLKHILKNKTTYRFCLFTPAYSIDSTFSPYAGLGAPLSLKYSPHLLNNKTLFLKWIEQGKAGLFTKEKYEKIDYLFPTHNQFHKAINLIKSELIYKEMDSNDTVMDNFDKSCIPSCL